MKFFFYVEFNKISLNQNTLIQNLLYVYNHLNKVQFQSIQYIIRI